MQALDALLNRVSVPRLLDPAPTAEQREVLLLIALERLSYEEAAKVLGIPLGTVMSRLHRARERLRTVLDGAPSAGTSLKVIK